MNICVLFSVSTVTQKIRRNRILSSHLKSLVKVSVRPDKLGVESRLNRWVRIGMGPWRWTLKNSGMVCGSNLIHFRLCPLRHKYSKYAVYKFLHVYIFTNV
jgi:hypothetical protein